MLFGYRLLPDSGLAVMLVLSSAVASAKEVDSTCTGPAVQNALITGRHLWNRRNNHLVCQSCTCVSTAQFLHGKYDNICENSLRKGSGTGHCRATERFHQDSLQESNNTKTHIL